MADDNTATSSSTTEGTDQLDGNATTEVDTSHGTVEEMKGIHIVDAGSGNDRIQNQGNNWDVVMGGSGNDVIIGPRNGFLDARGGTGNDVIIGGKNNDYIYGDEGNDLLIGGGGNDFIVGGAGDDIMSGGSGSDTFVIGPDDGNDTIFGLNSEDTIDLTNFEVPITWEELQSKITTSGITTTIDLTDWGGGTIKLLGVKNLTKDMFELPDGSGFNDTSGIYFDPDAPTVVLGTSIEDYISITSSDSFFVAGGEGNDEISSGSGNDVLNGGEGNDTLKGNAGHDILKGGQGNDTLVGGEGNDMLIGGTGNDTLTGGAGADTFVYGPRQGNDTITDFTVDEDNINLTWMNNITSYDQLNLIQDGTNTVIDFTGQGGGKITLENVDLNDLDSDDFTFSVPPADVEGV